MTDQPTDQHPTDQAAPIGYAIVDEREGDYGTPRQAFLIGEPHPFSDRSPALDDRGARAVAESVARVWRARDAETVITWRVVALVPVTGP